LPPALETLPKGHHFPPVEFDLSPQWVREYVAAVEDEAIGPLGQDMVPPMAVAALSIRALLDAAALPAVAIHLGQELAFLRPVGMGERLSARARVASRGERQGWALMGIELDVDDGAGRPVMTGRATVTMPVGEEPRAKNLERNQ
jgi:acyl dehydratase